MEVHHHSRSNHPGHKKKWSEYLLEFLMLFLAVFLGFLAENFRENKVEKHRVKEHMHTMVENLEYDTARYGSNLSANIVFMQGLDSFRHQIEEAIEGRIDVNKLYYFCWKSGRGLGNPVINDASMSQLRSSGLVRMITNKSLASQMGDYYSRRYTNLENVKISVGGKRNILIETYKLIFSYRGFDKIISRDTIWTTSYNVTYRENLNEILVRKSLQLLSPAKANFERLYNDVADLEWAIANFNGLIRYNHQGADSLIMQIKKEYHFD